MGKLKTELNKSIDNSRRRILGLSVKKLKKIKEPEAFLRRAVLINNTLNFVNYSGEEFSSFRENNALSNQNSLICEEEYDLLEDIEFPPVKNPKLEKFQCLELQLGADYSSENQPQDHEVPVVKNYEDLSKSQPISIEDTKAETVPEQSSESSDFSYFPEIFSSLPDSDSLIGQASLSPSPLTFNFLSSSLTDSQLQQIVVDLES